MERKSGKFLAKKASGGAPAAEKSSAGKSVARDASAADSRAAAARAVAKSPERNARGAAAASAVGVGGGGGAAACFATGACLKAEREKQRLAVLDIYHRTRIRPETLQNIEAGTDLPPPAYLRGFVRSYARALNFNEEEVLRLFEEDMSKKDGKKGRAPLSRSPPGLGPSDKALAGSPAGFPAGSPAGSGDFPASGKEEEGKRESDSSLALENFNNKAFNNKTKVTARLLKAAGRILFPFHAKTRARPALVLSLLLLVAAGVWLSLRRLSPPEDFAPTAERGKPLSGGSSGGSSGSSVSGSSGGSGPVGDASGGAAGFEESFRSGRIKKPGGLQAMETREESLQQGDRSAPKNPSPEEAKDKSQEALKQSARSGNSGPTKKLPSEEAKDKSQEALKQSARSGNNGPTKKLPKGAPHSLSQAVRSGFYKKTLMIQSRSDVLMYFKTDDGQIVTKALQENIWHVIKAEKKIYVRVDGRSHLTFVYRGRLFSVSSQKAFERSFD